MKFSKSEQIIIREAYERDDCQIVGPEKLKMLRKGYGQFGDDGSIDEIYLSRSVLMWVIENY